MNSHSVLITDGPKLQNLDPELNVLLLWYVRCKVLPSLSQGKKKRKKKKKKEKEKKKKVFFILVNKVKS